MNGCHEYQEMISRMLDDDLSRQEKDALAEHVKRCPDCAAVYVAFRSLSEHLGEELEEPSPDLHETIMADVRRESLRVKNSASIRHRRIRQLTTAAACLVLVAAAALSFPKIMGGGSSRKSYAGDSVTMTAAEAVQAEQPMPADAGGLVPNAIPQTDAVAQAPTAPERTADEPMVEETAEDTYGGMLILDEETSLELSRLMTGKEASPDGEPDREIRLVYLNRGVEQPLTVLLYGETAIYMEDDGDRCLFDATSGELLELLGLSD